MYQCPGKYNPTRAPALATTVNSPNGDSMVVCSGSTVWSGAPFIMDMPVLLLDVRLHQ